MNYSAIALLFCSLLPVNLISMDSFSKKRLLRIIAPDVVFTLNDNKTEPDIKKACKGIKDLLRNAPKKEFENRMRTLKLYLERQTKEYNAIKQASIIARKNKTPNEEEQSEQKQLTERMQELRMIITEYPLRNPHDIKKAAHIYRWRFLNHFLILQNPSLVTDKIQEVFGKEKDIKKTDKFCFVSARISFLLNLTNPRGKTSSVLGSWYVRSEMEYSKPLGKR